MQAQSINACVIIIGNEILSGRTQDTNLAWLAKELNNCGVHLAEARVIPDIEKTIIATLNACRLQFSYVFTTGGIGPTHDDITSAAIAKAFNLKLEIHPEAEAILERQYGREKLNPARLKMAYMPKGASLILNPVSAAPGFRVENVFVMAGVPAIMRAMFDDIRPTLKGGAPMLSKTVSAYITESMLAEKLEHIQNKNPDVEIGSYPFVRDGRLGTSLVSRATDALRLDATHAEIKAMLLKLTPDVTEEEPAD